MVADFYGVDERTIKSYIRDYGDKLRANNGRAGGGTKYINWRDRDYLPTAIKRDDYRKNFTQAVSKYVDGVPTYKYEQTTDLIYKAVFRENTKEYRVVLRLQNEENVRHTLYAEVLLCISSFHPRHR